MAQGSNPRTLRPEVLSAWNVNSVEKNDKNFQEFLNCFIRAYEHLLNSNYTGASKDEGPHLSLLPTDLLTVFEYHLKKYRLDFEATKEQDILIKICRILQALCILCRNFDNIPFVASCDFIAESVVIITSVLQSLTSSLEENESSQNSMLVSHLGLYFFECLYDPYFNWRTFLNGQVAELHKQHYSPAFLHIEVIPFFYDCFQVLPKGGILISVITHCLHMFGSLLSGSKHNALKASCPATLEVLFRCILNTDVGDEVRDVALDCLVQCILGLLKSKPDETQVDVFTVMEEFCQLLWQMGSKEAILNNSSIMSKILVKIQKLLHFSQKKLFQGILGRTGWIQCLLDKFRICASELSCDEIHSLSLLIIQTFCLILVGNKEVKDIVVQSNCFEHIFETLKCIPDPPMQLVESLVSLMCDAESRGLSAKVVHVEMAIVLVRWLPLLDSLDLQHWLADMLLGICSRGIISKRLVSENGLITVILSVISSVTHVKAAASLIKLVENIGTYSITPMELKTILLLLRPDKDRNQFAYTTSLMHAILSMARRESSEEAAYFFDFQDAFDGITIPPIARWYGSGFTFHAWVRLNDVTHQDTAVPLYRRQLYKFCTTSGCGFEAFFLPDGILIIAVLTKKEYLTVSVTNHPINDSRWHSITVCHSASRRPFMQTNLVVYIDGKSRLSSQLKCASFSESFTHCHIANGGQQQAASGKMANVPSNPAERLLSNLSLSSFFSLPLPLKSGNSYEHGVTVLTAGIQDKVWGMPCSLQGQLSSTCIFHDVLQPIHVQRIHAAGPNNLMLFSGEDLDLTEIGSKLVLFYHAKVCLDGVCMDISQGQQYDGHITGHCCVTWDIKESIHCVGGVQALFPLLEISRKSSNQQTPETPFSPETEMSEDSMEDWVVLPSASYSEWKIEQNQAAAFLILIRNFIQNSTSNKEYLLSTNGVATIGALLQKIPSSLVDVHLLMATQLLLESCGNRDDDIALRHSLYQHLLFDFRIWCQSDFAVRIGHIQYLSTIIKDDRKYFRKKYGVIFLLDVIRHFYSTVNNTNLAPEDCKAIRVSLIGLIRYFIARDVNSKEMSAILGFLFSVKEEEMVTEMLEMLLAIMEHKNCKDQIYLLIYEQGGIELMYCLLLNPIYSIHFRCLVLKLVTVALKTNKVYEKSKVRLRLQDVGFAGLVNRLEGIPVSNEMAKLLVDEVLMTDNIAAYQGILVLLYFIRFTDINLKLQVAQQVAQLVLNANSSHLIASQFAWHDCILQLLVKSPVNSIDSRQGSVSEDTSDKVPLGIAPSIISLSPNKEIFSSLSSSPVHFHYASPKCDDVILPPSPKVKTPQYFRSQVFDFDTQSLGNRSLCSSRASSLEDLSTSQSSDVIKMQESSETNSSSTVLICSSTEALTLSNESKYYDDSLITLSAMSPENFGDDKEELCQLVVGIIFTVMWKGIAGANRKAWKERGQVFTCINILALSNQLYVSHLDLKRRILELLIHAAVNDLKDAVQANADFTENAMEVMKWTYDFVVVDASHDHAKKLSAKLLDGVLALLDTLMVFEDSPNGEEWAEMAQMGMRILLECAASENLEICAMATPKLHVLIQTRMTWSKIEELLFLLEHLDRILGKTVEIRNQDHYSFIIPLVKAILETAGPRLPFDRFLPMLPSNQTGPSFFEDFQQYCQGSEWRQFIEKHVKPIALLHTQPTLSQLPDIMNEFWNECCEGTIVAIHRRNREWGESRLRFQSFIMEPFSNKCIEEQMRFNSVMNQMRNQNLLVRRRWRMKKLFLQGHRGPWKSWSESIFHWKLSHRENCSRMRLKLVLNHHFDLHTEASRLRDNLGILQLQPESLPLAVAREARTDHQSDDSLNAEDMKALTATEVQEVELTGKEKLLLTEECELVVLMSVLKGRLELTTTHMYFFDTSLVKEDVERYDFRFPLSVLREVHLRRYNLRRSALEFFLLDQTNYFLNFNPKSRNKVYSKILGLRPPNLFMYSTGSPAEVLKASSLTQKWIHREISNFDYLMSLNTIAGRTFNDLSQYPVFPWILKEYNTEELDLTNPDVFRDLSKPIGVVNPNNVPEVKAKYDHFEDPTGFVEKFHYGTHYSNSAGVLHYLVRLEPFTSLHIELQSGRFDVADRQFHSIPGTWRMLMENPNDVKELIPEFFYLPEFLVNMNGFDLGRLQGSKELIGDVVLPKWAKTPEEFILKHRQALESEYVSKHIHEWIDLIFGYKQKGLAAIEALNVFYYCSYEGAVNLDTITDPVARAAMEGMINNFGQTPCQLLKEPHPARLSLKEIVEKLSKLDIRGVNLFLYPGELRLFEVEMSNSSDPTIFIAAPNAVSRPGTAQTTADSLVTVTEKGYIGLHNWLPYNKTISSFFTLEIDPTFTNTKTKHRFPVAFQMGVSMSSNLFAVSHDARLLYSGGFWDNSIRIYKFSRSKSYAWLVGHKDTVTCLAVDRLGRHLISGSRDHTCIIWDISCHQVVMGKELPAKHLQVLYGHDDEVTCVCIAIELDMAISGAKDGTINVHTVHEGLYLRTLTPNSGLNSEVSLLTLSDQGHIIASSVIITQDKQHKHSIDEFSINGKHLWSECSNAAITALLSSGDFVIVGNSKGQINVHNSYGLTLVKSVPLPSAIRHLTLTPRNTHILAALQSGRLMVIGLALPVDLK